MRFWGETWWDLTYLTWRIKNLEGANDKSAGNAATRQWSPLGGEVGDVFTGMTPFPFVWIFPSVFSVIWVNYIIGLKRLGKAIICSVLIGGTFSAPGTIARAGTENEQDKIPAQEKPRDHGKIDSVDVSGKITGTEIKRHFVTLGEVIQSYFS